MKAIDKYKIEFNDLLQSDPDFNYSENEFYGWLVDMELANEAAEELSRIFDEELSFCVKRHEQDGVICADVIDYTYRGVEMAAWLNPFTPEEFKAYVDDFDVDEQIDLHRQDERYRNAFSCRQSVEDFTDWQERLENAVRELEKLGLL